MRTTTITALMVLAAVAIAALAGVFSSASPTPAGLTGLQNAADATATTTGVHVAMAMSVTAGPVQVTASGGGEMDPAAREASIGMSIDATGTQTVHTSISEILKGSTVYVQSPQLTEHLPGSARWVSIDVEQLEHKLGFSTNAGFGVDPNQYLDYLRSAGANVQPVGTQRLRGATVRVYRGSLDLVQALESHDGSQAAQKLSSEFRDANAVPFEAWIDTKHRLRKEALSLEAPQPSGPHISVEAEYFGFGPVKPVTVPAPSETFDLTSTVLGQLEQG